MIEYPEQDGAGRDEELVAGGRPPLRRPVRIAIAAVLVVVVGIAVVLTVRGDHDTRRQAGPASGTPSPAPTTSESPDYAEVTVGVHGNPCQSTPDGREMCFLDHLPRSVGTAIRAVFPRARIVTNYAGIIDPDGRLLDRQVRVDAGARKLSIEIRDGRVSRRPYRIEDAPGVRITSLDTALPNGRHVYIEVIDGNRTTVARSVLRRLAVDRRLLATA